jgi:transposase
VLALEKELAEFDQSIDDMVRRSPAWRRNEDLLRTVPSVGPIIARTPLAEMPELGTLDRREIAALAGLAPRTRQSGKWKSKTFIGGGRSSVRTVLFTGAMGAARFNPALTAFHQKLLDAGKPKIVATVAVASAPGVNDPLKLRWWDSAPVQRRRITFSSTSSSQRVSRRSSRHPM